MLLKQTVYVETSIVSYLTSRPSNDIRAAANQNTTFEWWETRRPLFDLFISEFVAAEAALGHPDAASRRMAVIDVSIHGVTRPSDFQADVTVEFGRDDRWAA